MLSCYQQWNFQLPSSGSRNGQELSCITCKSIFCGSIPRLPTSRHKVNPDLLYTPIGADGIELVFIDVAICTQIHKVTDSEMTSLLLWMDRVKRSSNSIRTKSFRRLVIHVAPTSISKSSSRLFFFLWMTRGGCY